MEYADEPRLVFSPLSTEDYCEFYDLEMDPFLDDASFYLPFLSTRFSVLELGCGSGRLTRLLAKKCTQVTGLDLSAEMIKRAQHDTSGNITYLLGDMADFNLDCAFDCILIPYNTLNLLNSRSLTEKCLQLCRLHLKKDGHLLFQVFHPNKRLIQSAGEKLFQFIILEQKNGDTLIKESIKSYSARDGRLTVIERYRDRPFVSKKPQRDLKHTLTLYVPKIQTWKELLAKNGFNVLQCFGDYTQSPFNEQNDTTLLIHSTPFT